MPEGLIVTPSFQAFGERAEVRPPVRREHLPDLWPDIQLLQIANPLETPEYEIVSEWLSVYPDVCLRVYAEGYQKGYGFLDSFQRQRRFSLAGWTTDALERLPAHTTHLWLEFPYSRAVRGAPRETVAPLDRVKRLVDLHVEGPAKALETIGSLTGLRELRFRSCTLPSLEPFTSLDGVHTLEIRLGSLADLDALPRIGRLRYLEMWLVKRLSAIPQVGELRHLQHLFLQSLSQITGLPPMGRMAALRRVTLDGMKGLRDLSSLRDAPALEELEVLACPQLREEHFLPLKGHPTLERARIGSGSVKRNAAIGALLGVPDDIGGFEFRSQ